MSIEQLRKRSQAQLSLCLWGSVVPAVVAAVLCLLLVGRECFRSAGQEPSPSGPLLFFCVFVAHLVAVSICYQNKMARALLAEIDALRGQRSPSEDGLGERPSGPGMPTS